MAVDREQMSANLAQFYDFSGKVVVCVGAGNSVLLKPSTGLRKLVAVDSDDEALHRFVDDARLAWSGVCTEVICSEFDSVCEDADVVYFEFCMHEIADPVKSLHHASGLAADIVIIEHLPESEWSFVAAEDRKVLHSAQAIESFGIKRFQKFITQQRFRKYQELVRALSRQEELAVHRSLSYQGLEDISIPMEYGLYLV